MDNIDIVNENDKEQLNNNISNNNEENKVNDVSLVSDSNNNPVSNNSEISIVSEDNKVEENTIQEVNTVNDTNQVEVETPSTDAAQDTKVEETKEVEDKPKVETPSIEVTQDENKIEEVDNNTNDIKEATTIGSVNKNNKVETPVEESNVSSNVASQPQIEIKEQNVLKGEAFSTTIGTINGDNVTTTNNALPEQIDISKKTTIVTEKNNTKKVKIVTKKEKILQIVISIFSVIVILGAGYAIYYFGYLTNPSIFNVKNLTFEYGEVIPQSLTYYVTSQLNVDDMDYNLDLSAVSSNIGTYTYYVTHKTVTKSGTITIKDTVSPKITFNDDLTFQKDTKIKKSDIVKECYDLSNCNYKLEYEVDTSTAGEKNVNIYARDDVGNEITESVVIKVIDVAKTIVCQSSPVPLVEGVSTISDEYTISFDSNDNLVLKSSASRVYYSDFFAYFELIKEKGENNEDYIFDRRTFSYTTPKTDDVNLDNLTTLNEIRNYFTSNGFTCNEKLD